MQVNFKTSILDIDGALIPLETVKQGGPSVLTLSQVCTNALLSRFSDEQGIAGEEMVERFNLAVRIRDHNGSVEINPEEIVLMRKLIAKGTGPLVCGRAWKLLEGTDAPSE